MWMNDGKSPLFVVKRKHTEEYYTGGYRTGSNPQLYTKGPARAAANRLNRYYDKKLTGDVKSYDEWLDDNPHMKHPSYRAGFAEGHYETYTKEITNPWIVAIVQFAATEYGE